VLHPTPPACQLLFCPHTIEDATKSSEDSTDEKKRKKKRKKTKGRECSLLAVTQYTGKVLDTDIVLCHLMQRKCLRICARLLLLLYTRAQVYSTSTVRVLVKARISYHNSTSGSSSSHSSKFVRKRKEKKNKKNQPHKDRAH